MRRLIVRTALPVVGLGLLTTACANTPTASQQLAVRTAPEPAAAGDSILDSVIAADTIKCGVRDDLPGFSSLDEAGEHVGFDADFCRVIAAAVLGDATKVEFVDVETDDRFTALQSGEIDVLVRNTTWTASRDGTEGATFLHPTFYDGQGMMVAADSGFTSRSTTWTARSSASPAAPPPRATSPPSSPGAGSTVEVQSFDRRRTAAGRRSSPGGATAGRATPASSPACAPPTRTGPTR